MDDDDQIRQVAEEDCESKVFESKDEAMAHIESESLDGIEQEPIEVNGVQTRAWELNANTAPSVIGEKVQMLTMANPQQVFRMFRADDIIFITAVEGEEWERVPTED